MKSKQLEETIMKRKRAKIANRQKEVDRFYKTLTNAQSKNRGSEMIIILPSAISKIIENTQMFALKGHRKIYPTRECKFPLINEGKWRIDRARYSYSDILWKVYRGKRYKDLDVAFPGHIMTSFLRTALVYLKLWDGVHTKVTLRTVYSSGRLYRLAELCGLDLEYECRRYGVKVLA